MKQDAKRFGEPWWGKAAILLARVRCTVTSGPGKRAAAAKMRGYKGSNPNFIREVGEAKTDLDSAEEMAIGRFTDG